MYIYFNLLYIINLKKLFKYNLLIILKDFLQFWMVFLYSQIARGW